MEIQGLRRRDREIKDPAEITAILNTNRICHLAMSVDDQPYVIPMIYAYSEGELFFHCAEVGQKLDMLRRNPKVCFEIQSSKTDSIVENSDKPCDWGIAFESVVGYGSAEIIDDRETKIKCYDLLIKKMQPKGYIHREELYTEKKIKGTYIIKVKIERMTGKRWDGTKPHPF
jgi:nitroimidazol reductase NimA-like FMN-containing flavoprotein (pyridoxamine 5'-phosphate oxidase superfamily)